MSSTNITYTGELVARTCWCGIRHAIPRELNEHIKLGHNRQAFCPLGHSYIVSGETEAERLRRQLTNERAKHDQTRADRDHIEAKRRGEKAAKTRLKKRISNGVCPCCKRSFKDLARHMAGQHPDYTEVSDE